jgi:hypothetical protein
MGVLILVLGVIMFFASWIGMIINFIVMLITKRKLSKTLDKTQPKIRNYLFGGSRSNPYRYKQFGKSFLSFGNKEYIKNYVDTFIDIEKIEKTEDTTLNKLVNRFIQLNSNGIRMWTIGVLSFIFAFIGVILK